MIEEIISLAAGVIRMIIIAIGPDKTREICNTCATEYEMARAAADFAERKKFGDP